MYQREFFLHFCLLLIVILTRKENIFRAKKKVEFCLLILATRLALFTYRMSCGFTVTIKCSEPHKCWTALCSDLLYQILPKFHNTYLKNRWKVIYHLTVSKTFFTASGFGKPFINEKRFVDICNQCHSQRSIDMESAGRSMESAV